MSYKKIGMESRFTVGIRNGQVVPEDRAQVEAFRVSLHGTGKCIRLYGRKPLAGTHRVSQEHYLRLENAQEADVYTRDI